jgi:hypothetical protein
VVISAECPVGVFDYDHVLLPRLSGPIIMYFYNMNYLAGSRSYDRAADRHLKIIGKLSVSFVAPGAIITLKQFITGPFRKGKNITLGRNRRRSRKPVERGRDNKAEGAREK